MMVGYDFSLTVGFGVVLHNPLSKQPGNISPPGLFRPTLNRIRTGRE